MSLVGFANVCHTFLRVQSFLMGCLVSCLISKFLKIQCLDDGSWEQGSCVPVVCEPPPPVFEGMYECTDGFKLDSQCVLNCNQETEGVRKAL
jgi:hypothetical protein